jgi:hypothetical protein
MTEIEKLQKQIDELKEQLATTETGTAHIFNKDIFLNGRIGFFQKKPVGRQATVSTANMGNVSGSGDDGTINNNFSTLANRVNSLSSRLKTLGIIEE